MGCVWVIALVLAALAAVIAPGVGGLLAFLVLVAAGVIHGIVALSRSQQAPEAEPVRRVTVTRSRPVEARTALQGGDYDDDYGTDGYEEPTKKVQTIDPKALDVRDLRELDSLRTRIVGTFYYLTDAERYRYSGTTYLLVLEPENEVDPLAIAVYGKGRKVGHIGAKRAAMMHPHLKKLGADAYLVSGKAAGEASMTMHADVPRIPPLRKLADGA